jgi:ATP-dependent Lhr-like helicase
MGVVGKETSLLDVSAKQLVEALRGSAPYVEALRFTSVTDYDWPGAKRELERIVRGEVEVRAVKLPAPSPLAALTINRYLYEFETFAPERVHRVVLNMVKGRLMSERVTLLCVDCLSETVRSDVGSLEPQPKCPSCGSRRLGLIRAEEGLVSSVLAKRGRSLSSEERRVLREAERTAELVERYGKAAVVALVGRNLTLKDAERILSQEPRLTPRFFELLMEAEKERILQAFR